MPKSERAALAHIRRVADSVLNETAQGASQPERGIARPVLLPVPYVSQLGPGADRFTNSSGAAAGVMLMRAYGQALVTPDEFFLQAGNQADTPLSLQQIRVTLGANGVQVEQRSGLKLGELAIVLITGRPAIIVVKHAVFAQAGLTLESFFGPHYLVALGLDLENIYLHDPLRRDGSGQGQAVPWLVLYQAWTQAPTFERGILIPRLPLLRRIRVTASTLNLRQGPGTEYDVVGLARSGEVFEVTIHHGDWGKVGENCWISLLHIEDI
ncbi:MAG: SH3 domain-containing protein [Chloroflexota bacterium]